MDFKYVPVLKNRQEEISALKTLYKIPISHKVMPLIEIVQNRARTDSRTEFHEDLEKIFGKNTSFMIDVVKKYKPTGTTETVRDFLIKVSRDFPFRMELYNRFNHLKNAIPVISYDPENYTNNEIRSCADELRPYKRKLAFRIKIGYFIKPFNEVKEILTKDDILILDLENQLYSNPDYEINYNMIKSLKKTIGNETIIINCPVKNDVKNLNLINGKRIDEIDCGLKNVYVSYGFDAFGDYANIKNELPSTGGTISPGFIFYSWHDNCCYGFKGNRKSLEEFKMTITPSIVSSACWNKYSPIHHENCPGCKKILEVASGIDEGKSQGLWKRISSMHYIYTMDEFL